MNNYEITKFEIIRNYYYGFRNFFTSLKYNLCNRKDLNITKNVKKLRFENRRQKVYIIGNGPSLRENNLNKLINEDVITVNQINRSEIFSNLKPKYHVISDDVFFNYDINIKENRERYLLMKDLENYDLKCIFPLSSSNFIKQIDFKCDTYYYIDSHIMTHKYKNINFEKIIPQCATVVHTAIYLAIYLGYKEINLLGVDNTNFNLLLNYIERKDVKSTHVYSYSIQELENIDKIKLKEDNMYVFLKFYNIFKLYKNILRYSIRHGIKIYNLSGKGILDVFELENLGKI